MSAAPADHYRPDIDGLRAVAVLAVIAYHGFPWLLPGGFCGVDVFFVLSGYLITGIIRRELDEGRFSLGGFWARRIRRIFPALATTLLLCLVLGHRLLLPSEYRDLGLHATASVAFAENFLLYFQAGYFAPAAERIPLLHLWSLAIEEQFYLLYPPLLLLLTRLRLPLRSTLLTLAAASLASCIIAGRSDPSASFYLPWNRAWELLAGGLLATTSLGRGPPRSRPLAEAASLAGFGGLAFAMFWLHGSTPYPGWHAAVPVGATVLVLAAGERAWLNRTVLGNRALVAIGLVSYPLYLFHWPILSFLHLNDGVRFGHLPLRILAALGVATLAAIVTYLAIERPLRRRGGRAIVIGLCIAMATLGGLGAAVARGLVPNGNDSPEVQQVLAALSDRTFDALPPTLWKEDSVWIIGGDGPKTLFHGDSMIQQCLPRMARLLEEAGPGDRGAIVVAHGGMPPIPGVRNSAIRCEPAELEGKFLRSLDGDASIDRVVLGGGWLGYLGRWSTCSIDGMPLSSGPGRDAALASLEDFLRTIVARGKRVTLVLSFPGHDHLDPIAGLERRLSGITRGEPPPITVDMLDTVRDVHELHRRLTEICARHGVEVIDPMRFLCPDGTCIFEDADGPIRYDSWHLRATWVRDRLDFLDHLIVPADEP